MEPSSSSSSLNLSQRSINTNHSTSTTRRQPIRNRHLYRIQIRQALNNASSNLPHVLLNQETTENTSSDNERGIRNHRLGDTVAQSMAMQERDTGVRATALLINPQWNQPETSETRTAASSNQSFNLYQPGMSNESNNLSSVADRSNEISAPGFQPVPGGNSRISQMMDRFFSRFRSNRFSNLDSQQDGNYL